MDAPEIEAPNTPEQDDPAISDAGSVAAYCDVATRALADQLGHVDRLDAKIAAVLGPATLALVAVAVLSVNARPLPSLSTALLLASLAAYAYTAWRLLRAYAAGDWAGHPALDTLGDYARVAEEADVRLWVADTCRKSVDDNGRGMTAKAAGLNAGIVGFVVLVACLAGAMAVRLLSP
jgi:hypothetical protein